MRIILQGDLTPTQLGKAVQEILETTISQIEDAKTKRYPLHNPVIEFNLNIQGTEEPQLLMDEEKKTMYAVQTGYKNGEFVEYIDVDRTELVDKFNRMVADSIGETEAEQYEQLKLELDEKENPVN